MSNTLKLGNGKWATGKDTVLGYNSENNNIKPLAFSFSRASSGTVINKDGLIETVGSGEPRIDFKDNTKGALLLEPSRTNSLVQSNQFDTTWLKSSGVTITSEQTISPEGINNGWKFEKTAASYKSIGQNYTSSSETTFSIFAKKGTLSVITLLANINGGTNLYQRFDLENGIVSTGSGMSSSNIEEYGNGWYRCSSTFTNTDVQRLDYFVDFGENEAGFIYIYGAQAETNSSYATSYIPTSGSAVTRVADSSSQTVPDGVIGQTEGTLFTEFEFNYSDSNTQVLLKANQSSDANSVGIEILGTTIKGLVNSQSSNIANIQGTIAIGTIKAAIAYKSNDIAFYVNGVQVGVITSGSIAFAGVVDILTIGHFSLNGGQYFPASRPFNQAQLYNTRLSNSELAALTTI